MVPRNVEADHEIFVTGRPWTWSQDHYDTWKLARCGTHGSLLCKELKDAAEHVLKKNIKFYKWKFQKNFLKKKIH